MPSPLVDWLHLVAEEIGTDPAALVGPAIATVLHVWATAAENATGSPPLRGKASSVEYVAGRPLQWADLTEEQFLELADQYRNQAALIEQHAEMIEDLVEALHDEETEITLDDLEFAEETAGRHAREPDLGHGQVPSELERTAGEG